MLDMVAHVFTPEARDFYRLDRLWSEAPQKDTPRRPRSSGRGRLDSPPGGGLAQLGERYAGSVEVTVSSPVSSIRLVMVFSGY